MNKLLRYYFSLEPWRIGELITRRQVSSNASFRKREDRHVFCKMFVLRKFIKKTTRLRLDQLVAAFRPTSIGNLAFAHKGFTFNSFSIVFSVLTFQGIVFLESLRKR